MCNRRTFAAVACLSRHLTVLIIEQVAYRGRQQVIGVCMRSVYPIKVSDMYAQAAQWSLFLICMLKHNTVSLGSLTSSLSLKIIEKSSLKV